MTTPSVTLYGKLPSRLDFVRVRHDTDEALAFDTWLQAAVQQLALRSASWPEHDLCFLLHGAGSTRSLIGAITPSRDRAGRKFPLAVFATCPLHAESSSAAIPLGAQPFLEAAHRLLQAAKGPQPPELHEALTSLTPPTAEQLDQAHQKHQLSMTERPAGDWLDALHEPGELPDRALAYRRVLAALQARVAGDRSLTWDLTAATPLSVATWLSIYRLAGEPDGHSAFWSVADAGGRLLLSPGRAPAHVPLSFASSTATASLLKLTHRDSSLPAISEATTRLLAANGSLRELFTLLRTDLQSA